jgi:hypothetical protein
LGNADLAVIYTDSELGEERGLDIAAELLGMAALVSGDVNLGNAPALVGYDPRGHHPA